MNYGKKGARDRQKKLSKTSRKVKSKCTVTAFNIVIICLLVSLVAIACTGIGIIKGIIDTAPDISSINVMPSGYSTSVYDNNGTRHTPNEWFQIPYEIINQSIELIINGKIVNYIYDRDKKELIYINK